MKSNCSTSKQCGESVPFYCPSEDGLGLAGQYTLSGTPTGNSHTAQPTPGYSNESQPDGTSDGQHNYTVQYVADQGGGNVIQTDANWQNPAVVFNAESNFFRMGIAYDLTNNSLWISGWGTTTIGNYSLDGTPLSSFNTGVLAMTALAYDHADNTLWLSRNAENTLEQWSKTGVLLQSGTLTNLPAQYYLAGEFALFPVAISVPEPASLAIWGLGAFGCAVAAYRRRKWA